MNRSQLLPAWLLVLIDLLLIGALLCAFAYFHHVRTLWGSDESFSDTPIAQFTKPQKTETKSPSISNDVVVDDPYNNYDYSGDFGASLPQVFLSEGEETIITDSSYRSQDIYLTLTENNVELEYNDKTYKVQYYVYDFYVRNIENLFTVAVNKREPIEDLIDSAAGLTDSEGNLLYEGPAIAAVNGDYWGNINHTQVAVRNGSVYRASQYISSDICVLYYDGTMETFTPSEYDWDEIASQAPYQIWEFGPGLLDEDGNALSEFSNDSYDGNVIDNRHPRCAIGYYEPGHYCFVVVDGRSDDSDGVRMFQLADIFEELGCKAAYNFDGGDSCQAYFGDQAIRVAQSKEVNGEEQRALYDIVAIGELRK